ncbi:hypothetical protein B0H12DRAFT_1024665, partial [Mycena haematopus]
VRDVPRVGKAIASGNLTQKITVSMQGDLVVQLKTVVNNMIDNFGHPRECDVEGTLHELMDKVNTLGSHLTLHVGPILLL